MTAMSDSLENLLLDHVAGTTAFTMPSGLYLALYEDACTDASPGTEVTGGSYAPQPITVGAASGGAISNTASITFPNMPATTIESVAVWFNSSTADPADYGFYTAVTPITVPAGVALVISVGEFSLTFL